MSNQKNENINSNENKNQYKNLKEQEQEQETNNQIAAQQNQYLDNIATSSSSSNLSNTTNKVTSSINEYQQTNKAILDKSIDTTNKYQQQQQKETINTTQALSNNYIDLQQNLFTTFQSSFSKFIDDMFKSYCNNFIFPTTYSSLFAKSNQHILDNAIKNTRTIHLFTIEYTEAFKKSLEIAQKYYSDGIKNYFNYLRK
jgi:hypothetical protein